MTSDRVELAPLARADLDDLVEHVEARNPVAARAMLALAQTLGHRRLVAHHFVDNPASGRVLDKLGFRPVGAQRERHCAARGGPAMAQGYALDLAEPGNGSDPVLKLAA